MKTYLYHFLSFLFLGSLFFVGMSCQKDIAGVHIPNLSFNQVKDLSVEEANIVLVKYFDPQTLAPVLETNDSEAYKAFLGRVLFYDSHLSEDKSVSCASCHQQQYAFADNVPFSKGVSGNLTDRNSIGLGSFESFATHYEEETSILGEFPEGFSFPSFVKNALFWDERVDQLEDQMKETFANPKEMGIDLLEVERRVKEFDYAMILYNRAFEGQPVTTQKVIEAIGAFINTMESTDTPFNEGLGEVDPFQVIFEQNSPTESSSTLDEYFSNFSDEENNGKRLFIDHCASCHAFSLGEFFRPQFANIETATSNGLDMEYADKGLGSHTKNREDYGVFKIPGLRNVELTAPYMHDGRFATLEEVVDFYSTGIQSHPNLDPLLKFSDGTPIKMEFNEYEKADLVTFLKTLTSVKLISDEGFSNPFR